MGHCSTCDLLCNFLRSYVEENDHFWLAESLCETLFEDVALNSLTSLAGRGLKLKCSIEIKGILTCSL